MKRKFKHTGNMKSHSEMTGHFQIISLKWFVIPGLLVMTMLATSCLPPPKSLFPEKNPVEQSDNISQENPDKTVDGTPPDVPVDNRQPDNNPFLIDTVPSVMTEQEYLDKARKSLEDGWYEMATRFVREGLEKYPYDDSLKNLSARINKKLDLRFEFHYLRGGRKIQTRGTGSEQGLSSDDPYYLTLYLPVEGYVYIFQEDSLGVVSQLFPNRDFGVGNNPVAPGTMRVPAGFNWFYLDENVGTETIYMIASPWKQTWLEGLSEKDMNEKFQSGEGIWKNAFIDLLKKAIEAGGDNIPAIATATYSFEHIRSSKPSGSPAGR